MLTKIKQDNMAYSPVKNIENLTKQSTTGGSGIKGAKGAAIAGQVAGVASGLIDTEDALSKNSVGKAAAAKGLEYAAMGSALGPWGAVAGLAVGGVVGAVEGSKAKEEALKQVEINKGITASAEVDKNKYEMEQYDYSKINPDGTMATKYGVVKKLGAITGTVANNMSVAQYKDEKKFSAIAKELKPINDIKTNKNFATPGTGFKDNSGTNNQPKTVTSGDRAKNVLTKLSVGAVTGAGTSALMLGDLDKNGELSSYEKKRQNAIEKNMNK